MNRQATLLPLAVAALCLATLVALPAGVRAEENAPGFVPPRERIEEPYTNDKCLKDCHGVRGLAMSAASGEPRDLFVDEAAFALSTHGERKLWCIDCHEGADPNFHPRTGMPHADCRACHSETPPEGIVPARGLATLKMREIAPPPKESQKGEGWVKTVHAKAWMEGKADAPFCPQCHTAHEVRRAADPDSAVHRANLGETCGACHADEARSYDVGGALARWRLSGHGKGDLSNRYADDECLACHQGEAAHGEETVTGQRCPECHRPAANIEAKAGGFHLRVGEKATLGGKIARIGYNLLFWGAVAAVLLLALLWGFTARFGSGDGDDS